MVVLSRPVGHPNVFRRRIQRVYGYPRAGDWVAVASAGDDEQSSAAQARAGNSDSQSSTPGHRFADERSSPAVTGQAMSNSARRPRPMISGGDQSHEDPALKVFAYGWYNPKSELAVRIVRWSDAPPDKAFWNGLLDRAVELRTGLLKLDEITDSYRVLHAEADGIPGLVVDRYADCLSGEVFSLAAGLRAPEILRRLQQRLGTRHWLLQPAPHLLSQEGVDFRWQRSADLPPRVSIREYDLHFQVDFAAGHKTGFFCDQRDNRRRLTQFCPGQTVLDLCTYTGGFAIAAAKAGARSVVGVDLDAAPLELARRNAAINRVQVRFTQADAFGYMRDMLRGGKQFDVVVLDPPKLIRNRSEVDQGTRKHFDLNRLAMQLVRPGGVLLTCTCSGLLSHAAFKRLVYAAARSAWQPTDWNPRPTPRSVQVIGESGAAACHPVAAHCPETEYLKAIWLRL
ncbi:MAG: oxidoreductase [Pirellulaceae bacterium]|nr:MAG: oxidoreductase [Pirellulaceae bacterium]